MTDYECHYCGEQINGPIFRAGNFYMCDLCSKAYEAGSLEQEAVKRVTYKCDFCGERQHGEPKKVEGYDLCSFCERAFKEGRGFEAVNSDIDQELKDTYESAAMDFKTVCNRLARLKIEAQEAMEQVQLYVDNWSKGANNG